MYYNVNFVKNYEKHNLMFVFHNETVDVEKNIITPMKEVFKPILKNMYFDRSLDETLLCLRYPDEGANERDFDCFFDSPSCAAFQHKDFKGVFIIDASSYKSDAKREITELIQYAKENVNKELIIICLFDSEIKKEVERVLNLFGMANTYNVDLELDDAVVESFEKRLGENSYTKLKESFNNPVFRTKSYNYVDGILNKVLSKDVSIDSAIAKLTIKGSNGRERRIGF